MKLIVQSDDYAISKSVAAGCVEGIKNGIIRNTGFFTNMPWSEECFEWIKPYLDQIAFGIDFNITTGSSILPHDRIPSITKEDGSFFTSRESRTMDMSAEENEHAVYEDVYAELKAQIEKFIEITGRKPDYCHAHAYTTNRIIEVERQLAREYEIPFTNDVWLSLGLPAIMDYRIPWYIKPAALENQAASSLEKYILDHKDELIQKDYVLLCAHMGYVDAELMELSSYSLLRTMDLKGALSKDVKKWIEEENIELFTYKNI